MLQKSKRVSRTSSDDNAFAIVASKYNARFVDCMVARACQELESAGAKDVRIVRVPGAFEIPVVAAALARDAQPPLAALICLGVILRGETTHAQHIGESVSQALVQIQIQFGVPVIHEVLLLENEQQAIARCLDEDHNRGAEAAHTALEMARIMRDLRHGSSERTDHPNS